jgi:predicted nucleotidyltransferase
MRKNERLTHGPIMLTESLKSALAKVPAFCERWSIAEFSLFGSVVRADFRPESDIDVLLTFLPDAKWSLVEWVAMREELQELFARGVDLVEKRAIRNPFRRSAILATHRVVYAA